MTWRSIAAPLMTLLALTGCKTTFDISPAQVPSFYKGELRSPEGDEQKLAQNQSYTVELIPRPGDVLMAMPHTPLIVAVPPEAQVLEMSRGLQPIRSFSNLKAPLQLEGGYLLGPAWSFAVQADSLQAIRLSQTNRSATIALITVGGVCVLTAVTAALVSFYSNIHVGWGYTSR